MGQCRPEHPLKQAALPCSALTASLLFLLVLLLPPPPQVRVNSISAGPLGSRAAKAIGFIDDMIR